MAADTRPFKSKEQDGQGNEVIIRDQQLVEQTSQTTMASGEYFEIVDVDGRMAKIPKANMMSVVLEAIRLLLDDRGSNISAANLTKILGLSASSIGNILPTDLASVLGGELKFISTIYIGNTDVRNWIDANIRPTAIYGRITFIIQSYGIYAYVNHSSGTSICYRLVMYNGTPAYSYRSESGWNEWVSF